MKRYLYGSTDCYGQFSLINLIERTVSSILTIVFIKFFNFLFFNQINFCSLHPYVKPFKIILIKHRGKKVTFPRWMIQRSRKTKRKKKEIK